MPEIFKDAKDLERKLKEHGYAVRRTIMTKAVRAGAEVIQERASQLAPRNPVVAGTTLAESIVIKVIAADSSSAEVVARIGPNRSAFYGLFQEKGTAFHSAQPFLNPALTQSYQEALDASIEASRKELTKLG